MLKFRTLAMRYLQTILLILGDNILSNPICPEFDTIQKFYTSAFPCSCQITPYTLPVLAVEDVITALLAGYALVQGGAPELCGGVALHPGQGKHTRPPKQT